MAESEDGFIARWSRRKREVGDEAPDQPETLEPRPAGQSAPPAQAGQSTPPAPAEPGAPPVREEDLPDPESMTAESDFSVFMKEGVPDLLRRRALRRLWRINPLFGHLDRLNDYDDDYTDAATVVAGLKTLYKVGQGFGDPDDDKPAVAEPDDEAAPPADAPDASAQAAEDMVADPDEAADTSDPAELAESGPTAIAESSPSDSEPAAKFPVKSIGAGGVRGRGARARRWGES